MFETLLQVGGSLLSGWLGAQGSKNAANTQAQGYTAAIDEQKRQFDSMLRLMAPAIASENSRRSLADAFLGVPSGGTNPLITASGGIESYDPARYGAGQPVAGHSGGGGSNPLISALGGQLLGGIFRRGGDDWQTLATSAPQGYDYDAYWNDNPDLAADPNGWNKKDVQALFNGNRDAYLAWHYNQFGKNEGRQLNQLGVGEGGDATGGTGGEGGMNPLTQSGATDIWKASPFYTAARSGFDTDRNFLQGSAAAGGKLISGGTLKALDDRAADRANQSASQFYTALANPTGFSAASGVGNAGMNLGANLANPLINRAAVNAQGSADANANWMKTFGNVAGTIGKYGQSQGWFGS